MMPVLCKMKRINFKGGEKIYDRGFGETAEGM